MPSGVLKQVTITNPLGSLAPTPKQHFRMNFVPVVVLITDCLVTVTLTLTALIDHHEARHRRKEETHLI
jgi:hypothetical protein